MEHFDLNEHLKILDEQLTERNAEWSTDEAESYFTKIFDEHPEFIERYTFYDEHDGHRERIWRRYLANPKVIKEHELVEMMLFNVIPRANTNEIAHRLLRRFGTLNGIFSATPEELIAVDGINISTARFLNLYSIIAERIDRGNPSFNFSIKRETERIQERIGGAPFEHIAITTVNKTGHVLSRLFFNEEHKCNVCFDADYFHSIIEYGSATSVLVAHNHPSGKLTPSKNDYDSLKKLCVYADMFDVKLIDCLIVTEYESISIREHAQHRNVDMAISEEKLNDGTLFDYVPTPKELPPLDNLTEEEIADVILETKLKKQTFLTGDDEYEY